MMRPSGAYAIVSEAGEVHSDNLALDDAVDDMKTLHQSPTNDVSYHIVDMRESDRFGDDMLSVNDKAQVFDEMIGTDIEDLFDWILGRYNHKLGKPYKYTDIDFKDDNIVIGYDVGFFMIPVRLVGEDEEAKAPYLDWAIGFELGDPTFYESITGNDYSRDILWSDLPQEIDDVAYDVAQSWYDQNDHGVEDEQ